MAEEKPVTPYRVLFVCTGNTCRSPMAEGILKQLAADRGNPHPPIEAASAGTMGIAGAPATTSAVDVCAAHGIDLHGHASRAATQELLQAADLVLAMAPDHYEYCRVIGVPEDRLFLLRAFPHPERETADMSVPDPIGRGRDVYEGVFLMLDEALRKAWPEIVRRAQTTVDRG